MATNTTGDQLINKTTGWIDKLFVWGDKAWTFFGSYTSQYSKYIMYAILGLVLAKIFKFKFNINTGGGRK